VGKVHCLGIPAGKHRGARRVSNGAALPLFVNALNSLDLASNLKTIPEFSGYLSRYFLENTMNNPQDMEKKMSEMQEGMLEMHAQMHKIMDAKNPQEREELVQTHQQMMQQHMHNMQAMKDGGGMGAGK